VHKFKKLEAEVTRNSTIAKRPRDPPSYRKLCSHLKSLNVIRIYTDVYGV